MRCRKKAEDVPPATSPPYRATLCGAIDIYCRAILQGKTVQLGKHPIGQHCAREEREERIASSISTDHIDMNICMADECNEWVCRG